MAGTRHAGGRPVVRERSALGRQIERLAKRRNLTLDVLAEQAGVSLPTVYRLMSGDIASPRWATLAALAAALNVRPETLMQN